MTSLQPFSLPPRWLPLRLLLGGLIAALLLLPFQHHDAKVLALPGPDFWLRCSSSLLVLATGLLLALCIAVIVGLRARQLGPRTEKFIALLGCALACVPVVVLTWGFISGWIGRLGWPVESLMPAQFPGSQRAPFAQALWEFLAPALLLALPLCGEMIHAVIIDGRSISNLDFSLRARGVPTASRLWLHHLNQLLPLLRVRLQSLCLIAPVYLIIIEDALHFMGWGDWMAQSLRAGGAGGIPLGFVSGAAMLALLCACIQLLPGRKKSAAGFVTTLAWQPWLLWALGILALLPTSLLSWLALWLALLLSGSAAWYHAWNNIEAALPIDAARVCGATDSMIWRDHISRVLHPMLAAWICTLFAQTLVCMAVACALLPRLIESLNGPLAKLYRPLSLASAQDAAHTLADPTALIQSGATIALAALCLLQVSRIVQPRLS